MNSSSSSPRPRRRSSHPEPPPRMTQSRMHPALKRAPSSNGQPDFMREESIYLDQNVSQPSLDDSFLPKTSITSSVIDNSNGDDENPKRNRRDERKFRIAVEQASWLRRKFDLPEQEEMLASFSAALSRKILLQGRMYITSERICFYSRILRKVTKESFLFTSLARVKKRRSGLVANAIKFYFIDKSSPSIVIGSLNQRDRALELIRGRLRVLNPSAVMEIGSAEEEASVGSVGSEALDSEVPSLDGADFSDVKPSLGRSSFLHREASRNSLDGNEVNVDPIQSRGQEIGDFESSASGSRQNSDIEPVLNDPSSTDNELSLVWCTPDDIVGRISADAYNKKSERARGILNTSVKEAFNVLYISDWLRHYHKAVNNRDVNMTDWRRGEDGYMTREVKFCRPLNLKIGPKETRVQEEQRYSFMNDGGVIVEVQGENLDVPYATYFVVESFYELHPHGDGSKTLFILSVAVYFKKSTLLQGKIESSTLSETKTTYTRQVELAKERIDTYMEEKKASRDAALKNRSHKHVNYDDVETVQDDSANQFSKVQQQPPQQQPPQHQPSESWKFEARHSLQDAERVQERAQPSNEPRAETNPQHSKRDEDKSQKHFPEQNYIVEVKDSQETRWLRLAALVILVLTCLLLLCVTVLLNRVHGRMRALEVLVTENLKELRPGGE